jgi:hypothetical protein
MVTNQGTNMAKRKNGKHMRFADQKADRRKQKTSKR